MKDQIAKKIEEYRSEQSKLIAKARAYEEAMQQARADSIAFGGAIQACEQLLAICENAERQVGTHEPTHAG